MGVAAIQPQALIPAISFWMKTTVSIALVRSLSPRPRIVSRLILAALGLLVPGCGLFMDSPREIVPTVYRDPGVANTPTDNGNPPYVLNPYSPTTGSPPYTP